MHTKMYVLCASFLLAILGYISNLEKSCLCCENNKVIESFKNNACPGLTASRIIKLTY